MANTYSQLYVHLVFSVSNRMSLIERHFKEVLQKYITGIVQNKGNKLLAINSMPDHIHIFLGLNPKLSISDLVRDIKTASTNFINENKWLRNKFYWQEGYGAFSYSHSQIPKVSQYISNQEKHHKRKTFKDEYLKILNDLKVEYKEDYLFKWVMLDK